MRERERDIASKYESRMESELARSHLKEIFYFLEHGPRKPSPVEDQERAVKFQAAIQDILTSTIERKLPDMESVRTFEEILNTPARLTPYECPQAVIRVRNDHPMGRGEDLEDRRARVVRFEFNEDYMKRLALKLKRCLTDFYLHLFPAGFSDDVKLIDICPVCENVFLKNKSHQVCCGRSCTNKLYYRRKNENNPNDRKNRAKSMRGRRKATALAGWPLDPRLTPKQEMARWNEKHRTWRFRSPDKFRREKETAQKLIEGADRHRMVED